MPLGGGTTSINAVELRDKCDTNGCSINSNIHILTNHDTFIYKSIYYNFTDGIYFEGTIDLFINYGTITTYYNNTPTNHSFSFVSKTEAGFNALINYGTISGGISTSDNKSIHITNYGVMGGVDKGDITLTNYGVIKPLSDKDGKKYHFGSTNLTLQTSLITISENASTFNAFNGTAGDDSHLVLKDSKSAKFENGDSKIILAFSDAFEFGAGYDLNKLIVNTDGTNDLSVDFDRLMPKNDIYTLYKQGDYFIARLQPQHSAISNIYKSNIHTMNNFYTLSNSMIYPRKSYHSQNLGKKNPSLQADFAISLKSYESFAYRNESINRRIQRQNKRNYSRTKRNNNSVILSESEKSQKKNNRDSSPKAQNDNVRKLQNLKETQTFSQTQRPSQNLSQTQRFSQTPHNYYFILTPFVNHNLFFESGRYNLRGFDYGFLTAFSTQVAESNSLGTHFIFSYGSLGDSKDKDLSIKSLNLNAGINYKLDLIYDMYLKARGDFFYFLNQVKTLTMFEAIKPNNLGFGVSVSYGKDFDFGKGGVLGIEAGIDYKALKTNTISLQNNATNSISETYQKSLYNLIYVDLGMNYNKYFGNFGLNAGLGIKGNITANKLATSKIHIGTFNKSVDMVLDNDNFLGYANLGASYVMNAKNFDMEFSLAYYGNFGDRVISNGGGVEWRVNF